MVGPQVALGPVSGNERPGVVDDAHAERRAGRDGLRAICADTRSCAAAISASVSAPRCASHSATAARPSRTGGPSSWPPGPCVLDRGDRVRLPSSA